MLVLFLYCLLLWILQVNYSSPDQCTQELLHILKLTVKISSIWYDLLWTIRTPSWSFWKVYRFWFEQALRRVFGKSTDVWRWAVLMTDLFKILVVLLHITTLTRIPIYKKGGKNKQVYTSSNSIYTSKELHRQVLRSAHEVSWRRATCFPKATQLTDQPCIQRLVDSGNEAKP